MNEAEQRSLDLIADMIGLDEFERIAIANLLDDVGHLRDLPAPGSEEEQKLIEIGSLAEAAILRRGGAI